MAVLVIGNATLDLSFEVERLPLPGETLIARGRMVDAGGKGLNQAVVARRAGSEVLFCAVIGSDADARVIHDRLAAERLPVEGLLVRAGATDVSIIYVAPAGANCIVSTDAMAKSLSAEDAAAALRAPSRSDFLLMQGNLSRVATAACIRRARERGARILLNPAPIAFDYAGLWTAVDVAVVNEVESRELSGADDPQRAAEQLLAAGAGAVVTTLGAQGAVVTGADGSFVVPAPAVAAIDTTGAGDVFCGVLVAGLDRGLAIGKAVAWAVRAASLAATRRGTSSAFPSAAELRALHGQD